MFPTPCRAAWRTVASSARPRLPAINFVFSRATESANSFDETCFPEMGHVKSYAVFKEALGRRLQDKDCQASHTDISKIKAILYKAFATLPTLSR